MVSCNNEASTRFSSMVLHIRETVMLFAFMVFFFSRSGASFPSIVISPPKGDNNKYKGDQNPLRRLKSFLKKRNKYLEISEKVIIFAAQKTLMIITIWERNMI